jgi:putative addiction module killer protein
MLPFQLVYEVRELLLTNEIKSPYQVWFNQLPVNIAVKIVTAKLRMQQGNLSNIEWFRGIGEYKIDCGSGWRIYVAKENLKIILLLGGGNKKQQQRDIDRAIARWQAYKKEKLAFKKTQKINSSNHKE